MSTAKRTDEKLWTRVKGQILKGSKGGPAGKWSARKAQLAVQEYKKRGGGYYGKKSSSNSLVKWTKEKWDYISPRKKEGRYLPKKVRDRLSPSEKRTENRLKGTQRGKRIRYSPSVKSKMKQSGIF